MENGSIELEKFIMCDGVSSCNDIDHCKELDELFDECSLLSEWGSDLITGGSRET